MFIAERRIVYTQLGDSAFFVNGYPAPISVPEWRRHHIQSFPAFADKGNEKAGYDVIREAIESVYSMFIGVLDLWAKQEQQIYFDKTQLCFRLLICWWIADLYPEFSRGIMSTGGMPLANKKVGPISIGYNTRLLNGADPLAFLLSNPFGVKAHGMIKNALVRMRIRGHPMSILGREGEMGWFLRLIALGNTGQILSPNS